MMPKLDTEILNERLERMNDLLDNLEKTLIRHDLWHPSHGKTEGDEVVAAVTDLRDELKDLFDMVYESQLD